MEKNVLITIKGIQNNTQEEEKMEMKVTGTLYQEEDSYTIDYVDTQLDDQAEIKTTVKANNEMVSITRIGSTSTHMVFEKGVTHFSPYETPFGIFEMKTSTNYICIEKDQTNFNLRVEYNLEINQTSLGVTSFELHARDL